MWEALVGLGLGATSFGLNVVSAAQQNAYNKQLAQMNQDEQYQELAQNYYTMQGNVQSMQNQIDMAGIAIKQQQADIGSQQSYLTRWQQDADYQMGSADQQARQSYLELAGNFANQNVMNSEKGHIGGSAALLSGQARSQLQSFNGNSLLYDQKGGLNGMGLQSSALDLEAARQTALNAVQTGQDAIDVYDAAIAQTQKNIESQQTLMKNAKEKLVDYYGEDEANWGGDSLDQKDKWERLQEENQDLRNQLEQYLNGGGRSTSDGDDDGDDIEPDYWSADDIDRLNEKASQGSMTQSEADAATADFFSEASKWEREAEKEAAKESKKGKKK